ncbi:hypothetical protein L9F63_010785, partial [Diploptera punctata]
DMRGVGTPAIPQNVRGIEAAILNDRRVQLRALSQKFNISYGAVYDIVHANLKFRKVSARWVPKNLTDDHKGQRMMASLDHLTRYTAQGHDFLEGIVTGDESKEKIQSDSICQESACDSKFLAGKRFETDVEVKSAVRRWLHSNQTDFYEQGILKLVHTENNEPHRYPSKYKQRTIKVFVETDNEWIV